jgi:hypothetical protein
VIIVFGDSGRLLVGKLPARSPKAITGTLLPQLPFFLASPILLAHFFRNIATHCRRIHSALSKFTNGGQVSNVAKK